MTQTPAIEAARTRMQIANARADMWHSAHGDRAILPVRLSTECDRALRAYVRAIEAARGK